jgi:hypothetical protein
MNFHNRASLARAKNSTIPAPILLQSAGQRVAVVVWIALSVVWLAMSGTSLLQCACWTRLWSFQGRVVGATMPTLAGNL